MKVLIAYQSDTGNTRKLARAIEEGLPAADTTSGRVDEVMNDDTYDLVFLGFPVRSHSVPPRAAKWLQDQPDGTRVALFATHGSFRGGELAVTAFYHAFGQANGARILGTFGCQGEVRESVIEMAAMNPIHRAWAGEARGAIGHPDEADLDDAQAFARQMLAKATAMSVEKSA